MTSGRSGASELDGLSEGKRIIKYLDELADVMDAKPMPKDSAADQDRREEAMEQLQEMQNGGITTANKLMGPQSLEDKAEKLAYEQRLSAQRIKYGGETEDAAKKLIEREAKASKAYAEDAEELEKRLRRFPQIKKEAKKKEEPNVSTAEHKKDEKGSDAAQSSAGSAAKGACAEESKTQKAPTTAEVLGLQGAAAAPPAVLESKPKETTKETKPRPSDSLKCFAGICNKS